jgi:hypothetical protein
MEFASPQFGIHSILQVIPTELDLQGGLHKLPPVPLFPRGIFDWVAYRWLVPQQQYMLQCTVWYPIKIVERGMGGRDGVPRRCVVSTFYNIAPYLYGPAPNSQNGYGVCTCHLAAAR